MSALHMHCQYTHQPPHSTFSATDFHCKLLFFECVQAKYILRTKGVYVMYFKNVINVMKALIYMLIVPCLFFA